MQRISEQKSTNSTPITEEKKPVYAITPVQKAYAKAADCYSKEKRYPWSKSKLGGHFGLFSGLRHGTLPTEFGRKVLFETKDSKEEEEKACIKFLQDNGSLFDPYLSNIHSFTNYFLFYLRHENFDGYKAIVGKTYGIAFISNEAHTFYRKDTRNSATIFANGFRLKKASNQYSTRKHKYRQPYTNSHGISLSKSILSITKYK